MTPETQSRLDEIEDRLKQLGLVDNRDAAWLIEQLKQAQKSMDSLKQFAMELSTFATHKDDCGDKCQCGVNDYLDAVLNQTFTIKETQTNDSAKNG
jgi:hypothetical protein